MLADEARAPAHRERGLQWVARYKLEWRPDKGRQWFDLGTFRGNSDPTAEVAHFLGTHDRGANGALACRYLRLTPLECAGGGALRVGVYGHPVAAGGARGQRGHGAHRSSSCYAAPCALAGGLPASVQYTLTPPGEHSNPTFCRDNQRWNTGCRCSCCMGDRGERAKRARQARRLRLIRCDVARGGGRD